MKLTRLVSAAAATFLSFTAFSGASPAHAGPPPPPTSTTTTITLTPQQLRALPYNTSSANQAVNVWDDNASSIGTVVSARWDCPRQPLWASGAVETQSATITSVNQVAPGASMGFQAPLMMECSLTYRYTTSMGQPTITVNPNFLYGMQAVFIRH